VKVRNERRDRRAARKRVARVVVMPSSGEGQLVQFTEVLRTWGLW